MWSTLDNLVRYSQGGVLRWLAVVAFGAGAAVASVGLGIVYFSWLRV